MAVSGNSPAKPVSLLRAALFGAGVGAGLNLLGLWSQGRLDDVASAIGHGAGGAVGFAIMFVALAVMVNWLRRRRIH